ncbi:olfactory receptor 10G4-like [Polyodon spathula]|uniref:olfactory receptor 10G4-like n=1 Tax=Polyodon spathula TaxID=7913 RepID=UPI001B7F3551|nr:olfactory receptor 10G4-like [Polyodon spathula]
MASRNNTVGITEFIITGFSDLEHPKAVGIVILIIYSLILLGSSTNICIIASDKRLHTPMYFFICNLAIVDMMYTTSASVTILTVLLMGVKTVSYKPCAAQMFVYHLGDFMEASAIGLMAFDRLIAISNPLRYHSILTNTHILLLVLTTWVINSAVIGILADVTEGLPYCHTVLKYTFCDYPGLVRAACVNPDDYFVFTTIAVILLIYGNFVFILLSYAWIIFTVFKISSESRKHMFSTCFSHLIVVVCYFVPKFVANILTRVGLVLTIPERNGIHIVATLVPSLVNPVVYCLRTKEIRNRMLRIFKNNTVMPTFMFPSHLRHLIIQGKNVNLISILIAASKYLVHRVVDCGNLSITLMSRDPRLLKSLTFGEFVITFSAYRDVFCTAYPHRRQELDQYLLYISKLSVRYRGTIFYDYHKDFSTKAVCG